MILISGATGFIGRTLLKDLLGRGEIVRCLIRNQKMVEVPEHQQHACTQVNIDLRDPRGLLHACRGVDCVYHCAGYAHAFGANDTNLHWQVNFSGTKNLVEAAVAEGVKIFVFLSSIKAMAEPGAACVDEEWPGDPVTPYGQAKKAAEEVVLAAGRDSGMRVVILRLAMVYGPGSRGNLDRMAALVGRGLFPPLPETGNHRSLVHVDDVVQAMQCAAGDERAAGRIYIVAEPIAYSGRQIYEILCRSLGRRPRSWAVPASLLRFAAWCGDAVIRVTGRSFPFHSEVVDRLLGSAWYSPARIEQELGWHAKRSFIELASPQEYW